MTLTHICITYHFLYQVLHLLTILCYYWYRLQQFLVVYNTALVSAVFQPTTASLHGLMLHTGKYVMQFESQTDVKSMAL